MRKMKRKTKAIAVLATLLCLSVSVGVANINVVATGTVETVGVSTPSIVSLQNATAKVSSYKANPYKNGAQVGEKTVTGLLVDSSTAYSGQFSGIFSGSTTIEYKFPGTSQHNTFAKTGDALGDFYFRITSVADPNYWVQANIGPYYKAANEWYSLNSGNIYFSGSTWNDKVRWSNTAAGQDKTLEYATSYPAFAAPVFNASAIDLNNKLYIDVDSDGIMSIGYNAFKQNTGGKFEVAETTAMQVVLNGKNKTSPTDDVMDLSEGYTVSFGSNLDLTKTYKYDDGTEIVPTDAGTPVYFLSINGEALGQDTVTMQVQDKQIFAADSYRKEQKNYLDLNVGDSLEDISFAYRENYRFATSFDYRSESTPALTIDDSDIDWNSEKVGEAGKVKVSYNGLSESFYVRFGKTVLAEAYGETLLKDLSEGSEAKQLVVSKGADAAYGYSGLLVSASEAYTGSFSGVFYDSTSIRYKFPGKSAMKFYNVPKDAAKTDPGQPLVESVATNRGDGLGNFYFIVQSIANPSHSFEIHITSLNDNKAAQTAIYVKAKNASGNVCYYTKYSGLNRSSMCESTAKNAMLMGSGPLFNSDLNSAAGDFAENLYFDIDEDGIMSVYYDQRNTTPYWNFPAADNYGKYGKSEAQNSPLVRFDSSALGFVLAKNDDKGPSSYGAVFDASEGYTISFGSNFDMNGTYLKPDWNYETGKDAWTEIEDLSAYGVDGGTDVCFLSVGGVDLSQNSLLVSANAHVAYNGEYQSKDGNETLIYTMETLENLPASHSVLVNYGFSDNWCLEREKKELIFSVSDMVGVDIQTPGRYQACIELATPLENVRSFKYYFKLEVQAMSVLTLDTRGGYIDGGGTSVKYAESMIPELPNAVWYDVEFLGWYLEPEYLTQVTEITADLGSRTLYAKWLDEKSPVLALNGKSSFETAILGANDLVRQTDVVAKDNMDGTIDSSKVVITVKKPNETAFAALANVVFNQAGQYVVKYTVQDFSGNTATLERTIELLVSKGPEIFVEGTLVVTAYTNKKIVVPTATCADGTSVTVKVFANGTSYPLVDGGFVADIAGAYTVCYYAKNANGVESAVEYKVVVKDDEEAPVITLPVEKMEVLVGSTVEIPAVTVTDNADGELSPTITVTLGLQEVSLSNNQFVAGQLGAYTITYTAEDAAGMKTVKQIVVYARETVVGEDGAVDSVPTDTGCNGCKGSLSSMVSLLSVFVLLASVKVLKKKKN